MGYQPFDPSEGPLSRRRKGEEDAYAEAYGAGFVGLAAKKRGEYADTGPIQRGAQQQGFGSQIQMAGDALAGAIGGIRKTFFRETPAAPAYQYQGPDYSSAFKGSSAPFNPNLWK